MRSGASEPSATLPSLCSRALCAAPKRMDLTVSLCTGQTWPRSSMLSRRGVQRAPVILVLDCKLSGHTRSVRTVLLRPHCVPFQNLETASAREPVAASKGSIHFAVTALLDGMRVLRPYMNFCDGDIPNPGGVGISRVLWLTFGQFDLFCSLATTVMAICSLAAIRWILWPSESGNNLRSRLPSAFSSQTVTRQACQRSSLAAKRFALTRKATQRPPRQGPQSPVSEVETEVPGHERGLALSHLQQSQHFHDTWRNDQLRLCLSSSQRSRTRSGT